MKTLILAALTIFAVEAHAQKCVPESVDNSKGWQVASVEDLPSALQYGIYQIKASGVHLVADLICNHEKCTGFLNGVMTSGTIDLDKNDSSKVTGFSVVGPRSIVTKFNCN